LEFYGATISQEQTELTWNRLLDPAFGLHGLVAESNGLLVGLAHYSFSISSWQVNPDIYLEDLFVSAETRGQGVGKALILALDAVAKQTGSGKVWWETRHDNAEARRLYDSIGRLSEFVKYTRAQGR
jgi:ribosomal protein S18 acetylase RimI-like enzyme